MQSIEYSKSGNVVYHIDSDKRTVTAKIKCSPNDAQDLFDSQLNKHIFGTGLAVVGDQWTFDYCADRVAINKEYVGKAKCHPDDEFDIDFGKKLALIRAKEKYLAAMEKKLATIRDWVYGLTKRTDKIYYDQYRKLIENRIELFRTQKVI